MLLLLAWGLRAYRLGAQELRGDEAFSWNYVVHEPGPAALVERIVREGDPQPPIHYWVLQQWVWVFGDSEWAMRALSACLSLLLIPLVYQFASRAWNQPVGLIAAALTVLHPYQVWLAQDVRNMYQLAIAGGLVGTLLLPGVLRGHRAAWLGYVLAGAFALYSHYYALFVLFAHGVYVAFRRADRYAWVRWISAGCGIALLVLPWAVVILPVYRGGQLADPTHMPVSEFLARTGEDMALGPTIDDRYALAFLAVWMIVSAYGVVARWRESRESAPGRAWLALLTTWPVFALAGIYAVIFMRATFNTFYFLVAFPAMYAALAGGLLRLARERLLRPVGVLVSVAGVVLFAVSLRNYFFVSEWSKDRGMRGVAGVLNAYAQEGDAFIANFPDPAQVYYLRQSALPYYLLPPRPDFEPEAVDDDIAALAGQFDRLWFVPINAVQWDAQGYVEHRLSTRYLRPWEWHFNKLRLQGYEPRPSEADGYRPLQVSFEEGLSLTGIHVAVDGLPSDGTVRPGSLLHITLFWTAAARPARDYTVFVHALDADGVLVAQHDGPPQAGARPTSTWTAGEQVLDVHEFRAPQQPEAGEWTLSVGLYDPQTGERLRLLEGRADSVPVATLRAR